MQAARLATRLQREIRMLQSDPPPGVCAWPCDDSLSHLQAQIQGPDGTVYAQGLFKLEIRVPERYPFEPPSVSFKTPIYHPNIDSGGRICLDILNMPPKGAWKPSLNISTVLASVGLLLAEPNPDDGLMGDITAEYKHNRLSFDMTAKNWTRQYAMQEESGIGGCAGNPVPSADVQKNPPKSVANVKGVAPEASTELQLELPVCQQEVQPRSEVGTTDKSNKCLVVSTSKLNLGTKLSLEKGPRESGKQSINVGAVEVSSVTSKRALGCIENTVGTRQGGVQEFPPLNGASVESITVKSIGKNPNMRSNHNENSRVADGVQALGVSNVYADKTNSTGSTIGRFKRPRGGSASPPPDSAHRPQKLQISCPDMDRTDDGITTTSSVVEAAESKCLKKRSKFFMSASKASSNPTAETLENREKANDLEQDCTNSRVCVASDTGPVRIPLISKPSDRAQVLENGQLRSSEQASASYGQKAFVEMADRRQTPPLTSPSVLKSSLKAVPASTKEANSSHHRTEGQYEHRPSSVARSDLESNRRIGQHVTAVSVSRSSPQQVEEDKAVFVASSLQERSGAESMGAASSIVHSRPEHRNNGFRATEVEVILLPDDTELETNDIHVSRAVVPEIPKEPPLPVKPTTDVIVLDSESDDEPPKGRFRLSLSRRRGVKKKTKD